jgi:diguanylate cyclase (GGDEF)-like protein
MAVAAPVSDPLRRFFAQRADPYAGADHALACRLGAALWLVATPIALLLLLFAPPDAAIGGWGWPIAIVTSLGGIVGGVWMRAGRLSWNRLLVTSYVAVAQIALLTWLAGGPGQPYPELYLVVAVFAGAVHPPRRTLGVLVAVTVASAVPLVHDAVPTEEIGAVLVQLILVWAFGLFASALMSTIRAQRLGLRDRGDQAEQIARIDDLTGLWNRRAFTEALDAELVRARRDGTPLSLVLADVDAFKAVNDAQGHQVGDACLQLVADALRSALRAGDACFRWGGDEFALLLPDTPRADAGRVCERIEAAVGGYSAPDGSPLRITSASAELTPDMGAEELVAAADGELLERKRLSRTASAA